MVEDQSDDVLLDLLASGDLSAFDQLISRHSARVTRQARRLLAWRADVDDIVQEVFLTLWTNHRKFRRNASLRSWLLSVTILKCRKSHRNNAIRQKIFGRLARPESSVQVGAMSDEISKIQSAAMALPHRLREVVVLHYLEETPIDEIASVLGLTRAAVDSRLHRARKILGQTLKDLSP